MPLLERLLPPCGEVADEVGVGVLFAGLFVAGAVPGLEAVGGVEYEAATMGVYPYHIFGNAVGDRLEKRGIQSEVCFSDCSWT